jgi:hypothetical protein
MLRAVESVSPWAFSMKLYGMVKGFVKYFGAKFDANGVSARVKKVSRIGLEHGQGSESVALFRRN